MPECEALGARLWIEMPGEVATAHRVVPVGQPHLAKFGERRQRATLVRVVSDDWPTNRPRQLAVPIAELVDAAPLTPADVAEYDRLDNELAGAARPPRPTLRDFHALRLRALMFGEVAHA